MAEEESPSEERTPNETSHNHTEEELIYWALEKARQTVKPIVKGEMQGEIINEELLNLRLKG
jgi:hypothetical protein